MASLHRVFDNPTAHSITHMHSSNDWFRHSAMLLCSGVLCMVTFCLISFDFKCQIKSLLMNFSPQSDLNLFMLVSN